MFTKALLGLVLFGTTALLPSTASAQDWRYDRNPYAYSDRGYRDNERREHEWREHQLREWREREWREHQPRYNYGDRRDAYFYYGTPQAYYGYEYVNPHCR